jgi:glycosyltransferase involved in cell wall biosynthesis
MSHISVVIPTCDRPEKLFSAVSSVLAQTRPADEIIVVDNGRAPVAADTLRGACTVLRLPPRVGASRARNAGAERARGDYLAFLDDDDRWEPDYLERIVTELEQSDAPAHVAVARIDAIEDGVQTVRYCLRDVRELMPALFSWNPGVFGSNTVVERRSFVEVGGFDEGLITAEDRALFLELYLRHKRFVFVPEVATVIDRSDGVRLTNHATQRRGRWQFFLKYYRTMPLRERWACLSLMLQSERRHSPFRRWKKALKQRLRGVTS